MKNFIDTYVSKITDYTDAPLDCIIASAYWLVSATIGVWFDIQETPSITNRCNIFLLLSGKAGITRKSTVMNYAEVVYRYTWKKFYDKIGIDIDIDNKFCEEFTIEGIADQVDDLYSKGIYDFVLMTDEFGVWLSRTNSTHLLGSKGLLSKLYYGKSFKQSLSKRGGKKGVRMIPEGIYWTFFGAMQDPELYLSDLDIKQGFLRRFLFVNINDDNKQRYEPPISMKRRFIRHDLQELSNELYNRMIEIYNFTSSFEPIPVYFSQNIVESINNYDLQNMKMIYNMYNGNSTVSGYLSTSWEHVVKLTVLYSISDFSTKPITIAKEPVYNITDITYFKKSSEWFESIKPRIIQAIEKILINKQNPIIASIDSISEQIIGEINRNGGMMTTGELLSKLGVTKRQISDYIITLVEQGKIHVVFEWKGNKKSFKLFTCKNKLNNYIMSNNIKNNGSGIKIIDSNTFASFWL